MATQAVKDRANPRREEILHAARAEFTRYGFAGTSMRRIAEATGVTKAALYYHFADKHTLFRVAAEDAVLRRQERILARIAGIDDPRRRLRELVHAHLDQFGEDRTLSRRLYTLLFLPADDQSWVARLCRSFSEPLEEALSACAAVGLLEKSRLEETKILLMGGIEYMGVIWLLDPQAPVPTREMGDRLIAQLVPGALTGGSRPGVVERRDVPKRRAAMRSDTPSSRAAAQRGAPSARAKRGLRTAVLALLFPLAASLGPAWGAGEAPAAGARSAASLESATGAPSTASAAQAAVVEAIPGAEPLDLGACLGSALADNAALQAERMRRGELKGLKYQALSIGLPSVDASGTWSRGRDPSFSFSDMFGGGGDSDSAAAFPPEYPDWFVDWISDLSFIPDAEGVEPQTFWRASVNAHWQLNPALVYNAVGAAGLAMMQQELAIADLEHRTAEEVMRAYYGVLWAGEELAALDASLTERSEFLDVTRRRFLLGLSTPLDTLRAAVSLANLQPVRRNAAQALRDQGGALNTAMGREPLAPISILSRVEIEDEPIDAGLAERLVARRPDLQALDLAAEIQRKNRGAKKADHRPYLSADASYGYVTSEFDELTDAGHDYWSASLALTVPLFDGLATRGRVQEVEAVVRRLGYQYDQSLRQARLEVLSLHGSLEAARENLTAARLNLRAAEEALRQVDLRYELGKADYLAVLDVQSAWLTARGHAINAQKDVLTLTASLKRALGFSPTRSLAEVASVLERESRAGSRAPGQ